MKNFLIGMHGGFDESKYRRDFRRNFSGMEVCMFPGEKEVDILIQKAKQNCFIFGVHYPFIKKDTPYRDPFLLSLDGSERQQAFECFENEAAYAAEKGAHYILTHFPKPVLVNRGLDLQYWRFSGDKEWMFADLYPIEQLEENLNTMFEKLSRISNMYGIQVVLENDAIAAIFLESNMLVDMFKRNNKIKACLDIGRLHLQEKLDPSFKALEFAKMISPFTYLIHLWNTNPLQNQQGGHFPVLPEHRSTDGWADIKTFIEIINKTNKNVNVLFEHRSDLISDEDLNRCYKWVDELFGVQSIK